MVVDWEQETGLLVSSGDVRIVRVWDTDREVKVQVTAGAAAPGLGVRGRQALGVRARPDSGRPVARPAGASAGPRAPPQDIPTGADSCVTSLSCDSHRSLIVAGLGDGSVRVYDRRMALGEW